MKNSREPFPIFKRRPDLVYLDSAASAQKPANVLKAMQAFYENDYSNIHRGPHFLSEAATQAYEGARKTVAQFINAKYPRGVIFTRNATESINLVARAYGDANVKKGDEILLSRLEHHSNIVPWLQLSERTGAKLKYMDVTPEGCIAFKPEAVTQRTKIVAVTAMSNVTGTITDLKPLIAAAHAQGAVVLVDACQSAVHSPTDVQALDCDFLVYSGHKLYGPTGIGVLYGKEALLSAMPPFLGGGDMIHEVFADRFTPADLPHKFEAGTPAIAEAVGLQAAIEFIQSIGFEEIHKHEEALTQQLLEGLQKIPGLTIVGPTTLKNRGPVVSFSLKGVHPHDIAEGLSKESICIRAGHHCAQVLMNHWNLSATARISLGVYNTEKDIDRVLKAVEGVRRYFE